MSANERLILERCTALEYTLSESEKQRLLFKLCIAITTEGTIRYGEVYQVSSVAYYPAFAEPMVDELIEEILHAQLSPAGAGRRDSAPVA